MPKETALVSKIIRALKARGGWWIKIHGGASQETGVPDILGCYRGRFVAIEVKLPVPGRNAASPRQQLQIERIITNKGVARVVETTEEALMMLDQIDSTLR